MAAIPGPLPQIVPAVSGFVILLKAEFLHDFLVFFSSGCQANTYDEAGTSVAYSIENDYVNTNWYDADSGFSYTCHKPGESEVVICNGGDLWTTPDDCPAGN